MDIKEITFDETAHFIKKMGEKPFRASQIRSWVFEKGARSFDEMTNLSRSLRERLSAEATITSLVEEKRSASSDGTEKFLFRLHDGEIIESVWIPEEKRATLCISTQVGCKLDCRFCLTGAGGFRRNLSTGAIVDQLLKVRSVVEEGRVSNIVLMGMGEPLDNYDAVAQALRIFSEPQTALIGARKITLSTSGLAPAIERLAHDFPKIKLAVSLNASHDASRNRLMPINKKYPLARLMDALRQWPLPEGKRITLEYVLLAGINDSDDDAERLHALTASLPSKINLIPFNEAPDLPYKTPSHERVAAFKKILTDKNRTALIRTSRGRDILAACGQLAGASC